MRYADSKQCVFVTAAPHAIATGGGTKRVRSGRSIWFASVRSNFGLHKFYGNSAPAPARFDTFWCDKWAHVSKPNAATLRVTTMGHSPIVQRGCWVGCHPVRFLSRTICDYLCIRERVIGACSVWRYLAKVVHRWVATPNSLSFCNKAILIVAGKFVLSLSTL